MPFEQIASGIKTIEARLCDEKRQLVQLGDEIQFTNTDTHETIDACVVGLLRYASFHDMFSYQDPWRFGFDQGDSAERAAEMMRQYYSEDDEVKGGVLGIQIKLLG